MQNKILHNIFSSNEIAELLTNLEVKINKDRLSDTQRVIKFSIPLSDNIRTNLEDKLSIDLSQIMTIPMRWIRGDTFPHIDKGERHFDNTYLIYLTDSKGQLIIDGQHYSISAGDAHIFSEGLEHLTIDTENTERLMIGPMSESVFSVGGGGISYTSGYQNCGFSEYFIYGGLTTIRIPNIPPPIPSQNYWNYTGISDSVIWATPPGKIFGGWKLMNTNGSNPIGTNSVDKIYMPGEVYIIDYTYDSTILEPNWIDVPKIQLNRMNLMHFTDNSLVYYKKGSLASCGVGTVRNSSVRYKKI